MENRYLDKHVLRPTHIQSSPETNLGLVVIIPAYAEDSVLSCLQSLMLAQRPLDTAIEIIVVINHPELAEPGVVALNRRTYDDVIYYSKKHSSEKCKIYGVFEEDLLRRQAGVGLARKIGMDEAVRRFERIGHDGIIVNLDADCTVQSNYFEAILEWFSKSPEMLAASLYFEHSLDDYGIDAQQRAAIIEYELHLRYFIAAQRFIDLPFAYHTVGSAMAVRSSAYQNLGGMNVRKAGEDFYFLHKFIAINRLGEINATTVFPSSRPSFRVPFGTGKAVATILEGNPQLTYGFQSFRDIQMIVQDIPALYKNQKVDIWIDSLPQPFQLFFLENNAAHKIEEIIRETNKYSTFYNRFFQWFNAFRLMKYLHYARAVFPDKPVLEEALKLRDLIEPASQDLSPFDLLMWYRKLDRGRR